MTSAVDDVRPGLAAGDPLPPEVVSHMVRSRVWIVLAAVAGIAMVALSALLAAAVLLTPVGAAKGETGMIRLVAGLGIAGLIPVVLLLRYAGHVRAFAGGDGAGFARALRIGRVLWILLAIGYALSVAFSVLQIVLRLAHTSWQQLLGA